MPGPYRISQVCDAIGIDKETANKWLQRGNIEAGELDGGWRSFTLKDAVKIALVAALSRAGMNVRHANDIAEQHQRHLEAGALWIAARGTPSGVQWRGSLQKDTIDRWLSDNPQPIAIVVDVALLRERTMAALNAEDSGAS